MALRNGVADVNGRARGEIGDLRVLADCRARRKNRSDCMIVVSVVVMGWDAEVRLEPDRNKAVGEIEVYGLTGSGGHYSFAKQ